MAVAGFFFDVDIDFSSVGAVVFGGLVGRSRSRMVRFYVVIFFIGVAAER